MEAIGNTIATTIATTIANTVTESDNSKITTTNENNIQNPTIIVEKKKRGRKKNIKLDMVLTETESVQDNNITYPVTEKKIRKRRSKKTMAIVNALAAAAAATSSSIAMSSGIGNNNDYLNSIISTETNVGGIGIVTGVKVRKRRVCKSKNKTSTDTIFGETTGLNTDNNIIMDSNNTGILTHYNAPEEKVAKKRGRKPKGGKILTQKLEEDNNQNEMPNIILHLKCSISDIKNSDSDDIDKNEIQSYNNSSHLSCSDITSSLSKEKNIPNVGSVVSTTTAPIYSDSSTHLFKVYTPNILPDHIATNKPIQSATSVSNISSVLGYSSNEILNKRTGIFNGVYSPDINIYSNEFDNRNMDDDCDGESGVCKNEREIWKKISQLKISFHKSDICKNIGGTQRSACFWCTCEFDSPAIYIPKTLTKDVYNVYGCFCSPECSAAFLMNENIDTSTKFERYHLLNLLYGKIYKYEKSIKIAPNPFYLLNKFYGNLTIQEYRKLFQSDQMIYIVNKPLTHILPELYEDNNDFLLNNKIIPTNSVNIKKNKPLKSNIINNAFGVTVGGN